MRLTEAQLNEYDKARDIIDLPYLSNEIEYTGRFLYTNDYELSYTEIEDILKSRCNTPEEIQRMQEELFIFNEIGKLDLIKYFLYLVDYMNKEGFIWGVGRGSSVSVFIFYLIGVHKVNSVKYNLEYTDFFKIKE